MKLHKLCNIIFLVVTRETTAFDNTDNHNPLTSLSECVNKSIFEMDHQLSQIWIIDWARYTVRYRLYSQYHTEKFEVFDL